MIVKRLGKDNGVYFSKTIIFSLLDSVLQHPRVLANRKAHLLGD